MQSNSIFMNSTSATTPFHPFSTSNGRKGMKSPLVVMASSRSRGGAENSSFGRGSRLVDESMIVLRKRIHEMNMFERNYEPPSHWMDWEKRYYTSYDSIICDAIGLLQAQLMNTRPSLALGLVALVAISVPTSSALLLFHFVEFSKALFAGI